MTFVSPVNTMTLDCSGNVVSNALLLADVDMNKSNELIVGTQDGELLIFKAIRNQSQAQLWRRAHGLGFITAIAVGPVTTNTPEPRPIICVVNAEGAIHLFLLRLAVQRNRVRSAGGTLNSGNRNDSKVHLHSATSIVNDEEQQQQQQQQIQVAFSQQLICNPKILIIQEYNDNEKQIIIGYADRSIRVFTSMVIEEFDGRLTGRFALKSVFNIAEQIYTIAARRISVKDYELIVSQPGGNLLRFNPNEENGRILATDMCNNGTTGWTEAIALDRFVDETVYAAICHDHIDIFSNQLNRILYTIPLSVKTGYLCGLRVGPPSKDKYNQIVTISSVDGDTFIIDRDSNILRFRPPLSSNTGCGGGNDSITNTSFADQIQAFTSGFFGDNNIFCFIYVLTHNDKIIIVHSIETSNTKTANLATLLEKSALDQKIKEGY
ncbi:unnamed protein product [Adineta ricciae]|uniref:Uncharacterized protein n=1 Tax=Adineta ricciae TaxID=249248 RepID=A0A813YLQ1_ADIRI|nr:unnamed protein product [Adineta ricciae]CAF0925697.1 unnamed protein product [Adineta ricciae]